MPSNFEAMQASADTRKADHIGYSIRMMSAIAAQYNDALDHGDFLKASSMVDAFYVHLRLMADFLVRPTSSKDFGPSDFGLQ